MLTEVSLYEYRAHTATRIPLQQLTVLIGPNAAGKSSVLEAVQLLGRLLAAPAERVFVGARELRWLVRRGASEALKIHVRGRSADEEWEIWATAPQNVDAKAVRLEWDFPNPADVGTSGIKNVEDVFGDGPLPPLRRRRPERPTGTDVLRSALTLRLDPMRLSEPSTSDEEVPRLADDGYGLATVLSTLKLSSASRFGALEEAACRIVPSLRGIGFKRTRIERQSPRALTLEGQKVVVQDRAVVIADELVLDFADAPGLPAHAASEGTLIVLGILAALYASDAPRLLLLEDVERALHPKAQQDLIKMIRAALATAPEAQIIATSHSPYLVDSLAPDEMVVLGRGADGRVAARPLSEHPKAKALDVLTSGELWTAEGEEWVVGA
ncbi:AAA family ATPase [Sorangium sp. So ce1097]|uniref:AAA family ATPase n=1 Tax=Sorangium sp. So ce1097 TaxID=3133330 RepID=UPI003F637678